MLCQKGLHLTYLASSSTVLPNGKNILKEPKKNRPHLRCFASMTPNIPLQGSWSWSNGLAKYSLKRGGNKKRPYLTYFASMTPNIPLQGIWSWSNGLAIWQTKFPEEEYLASSTPNMSNKAFFFSPSSRNISQDHSTKTKFLEEEYLASSTPNMSNEAFFFWGLAIWRIQIPKRIFVTPVMFRWDDWVD